MIDGAREHIVWRGALVDTITLERPRVVLCSAPAGYGKSSLARQLASAEGSLFVDLADVVGEANLRERLELGGEGPQDCDFVTWARRLSVAPVVVFDHIGDLGPNAWKLLGVLLAGKSDGIVVLCSQRSLEREVGVQFLPTQTLILGERELRLAPAEMAELFGTEAPGALEVVDALTVGWPLAVNVLSRSSRLGRLGQALRDDYCVDRRNLDAYIDAKVIASLPEPVLESFSVVAALGGGTFQEVAQALRGSDGRVSQEPRALPFVREDGGRLWAHPLIASFLRRRCREQWANAVMKCCAAQLSTGSALRAVSVALAGDQERLAVQLFHQHALGKHPLPHRLAMVLLYGSTTLADEFPRLWANAMRANQLRFSAGDRIDWGRRIWSSEKCTTDPATVVAVADVIREALMSSGALDAVGEFECEITERLVKAGATTEPTTVRGAVRSAEIFALRVILERGGKVDPDAVCRLLASCESETEACYVMSRLMAPALRAACNRDGERAALHDAISQASRSDSPALFVECNLLAAVGAWLAGEDELFQGCVAVAEAAAAADVHLYGGLRHFLRCARGEEPFEVPDQSADGIRAFACIMAAGSASTVAGRLAAAREALGAAEASGLLGVRVLARLCIAAVDHASASHLRDEVRALVSGCEATALGELVRNPGATQCFAGFVRRFRIIEAADHREPIVVNVLEGGVTRGSARIALSPKEFALLAYVSTSREPIDTETLIESLWGVTASRDRTVGLRVYVNRIRRRTGDPSVVAMRSHRYARGPNVVTDLEQMERFLFSSPGGSSSESTVGNGLEYHRRLLNGASSSLLDIGALTFLHARINGLLELLEEWLIQCYERVPSWLQLAIDQALTAGSDPSEPREPGRAVAGLNGVAGSDVRGLSAEGHRLRAPALSMSAPETSATIAPSLPLVLREGRSPEAVLACGIQAASVAELDRKYRPQFRPLSAIERRRRDKASAQ